MYFWIFVEKNSSYTWLIAFALKTRKTNKTNIRIPETKWMFCTYYTMKLYPPYIDKDTVDHFGKKGLSWRGAMFFFSCPNYPSVHKTWYCDHMSSSDTKQDWQAVFSISEGIILQMKINFTHRIIVNIQTDNAKYYQTASLMFGLCMLFNYHDMKIKLYVLTKTYFGTGYIEAHIAVAMRHV